MIRRIMRKAGGEASGDLCGDSRTRRPWRRRAAALIEMAIVLPVLLLILLGILEWGWVFFKLSQVNQAARDGVRVGIRPSSTTDDVETAVADMMNSAGLGDTGYTVSATGVNSSPGQPVRVIVTVDYSQIELIGFVPTPAQLHGSATMAKEGPSS